MSAAVRPMLPLVRALCAIRTGVVADGNADLFARIAEELPLEMRSYPSGLEHNGWIVPQNWRVKRAKLFKDGVEVFDGARNALGVAYYSKSFSGELDRADLDAKLVSDPALPDATVFHCAWQYRPWDADWRLSMPHRLRASLGPGRYRVELETEYSPGEMLVGVARKAGRSPKTIVFNSNNCHPHMANDGFAGTAVLIRLMQWLAARDTHYSYRLVIAPEHLGSVFYLRDLPRAEVDAMVCGVFEEMPGTAGQAKATSTFAGGHSIDRAFANALRHSGLNHALVPWRKGAGNDETVWEAPGYEVPFVEFTRCEDQFAPYRGYHTDLDGPDLVDETRMAEMLDVLKTVVDILERDATATRNFDGLVCLSNPRFGLYMERPDPAVVKDLAADAEKWGHLLDCLFRYFDGKTTILDIAERHDLPFARLAAYLDRFREAGLIELTHAEIARAPVRRVGRSAEGRII